MQVVVFLREKGGRVGIIAVLVVVFIRLLLRVRPQRVHLRVGVRQLLLRGLQRVLRLGESDAVFLSFDQHGGILGIQRGQLILIRLLHGVLLPRFGVGAERGGAAVDGVGLQVDIVGQLRHHLAEQRKSVVILPVLLVGIEPGSLQLFQLADVGICNACRRHGGGNGIVIGGLGVVHRFTHTAGSFGQLLHAGYGVIRRGGGKGNDARRDRGHGSGNAHDDIDAGDRRREDGAGGCGYLRGYLRGYRVGGKRGDDCADHAHKGGDGVAQCRVFLNERRNAVEDFRADAVGLAERGGVGVTDRHFEIVVGVLHHGQAALRGGIALVGLVGEGGILLPCGIGGVHRAGHLVRGKAQGFEHIALPDAGQAEVFQHKDGALALLVQLAQPADERGQGAHGVVLPCGGEFLGGHTRDAGELCKAVSALCNGLFNGVERLGHGGAARLGFDADRGHRRRQSHDLGLGQSGQLARRRQARTHRHDLGFRRGEVVAEVDDNGAEPPVIVRCHAGDVGEARKGGRRLVRRHVGGGAEHGHDLGEVQQDILLNAQLSGSLGNCRDLLSGGGDLRGQGLDGVRHRRQLLVGEVGGLGNAGDGALKVHRRLRAAGEIFVDLFQSDGDACGHDGLMHLIKGLPGLVAEGHSLVRRFALLLFQIVDLAGELFRAVGEVIGVDARLLQRRTQLIQLCGLFLQRGGGLVDLQLLCQQLVLHVGGLVAGLLHLTLDIVVLLPQHLQPLPRRFHGCLLLLECGNIRLCLGEGLDFLLHGHDLLLRGLEGLAVAASKLCVQLE